MQETEDIVTRLQAMQRPGSESDLTVMCAEAATTIATLRAEAQELRADAERLDSGRIVLAHLDEFGEPSSTMFCGVNLRAAIDAAKAGKEGA